MLMWLINHVILQLEFIFSKLIFNQVFLGMIHSLPNSRPRKSSIRAQQLLWGCSLLLALAGCGGDSIERTVVKGKVTFDGQPLATGTILFVPEQGTVGAPVQCKIENGEFSSAGQTSDKRGAVVGPNKVEITAYKESGKQIKNPDGVMEAEVIQYIPAKYNTKTELIKSISSGINDYSFNLTP
jgi:hypothetical protein